MTKQELNVKLEEYRNGFRTLPQETQAERIYQLACQVIHDAMIDYVGLTTESDKHGLPKYLFKKSVIMQDLKNQDIMALSNGANEMAAAMLLENPEQVKQNLRQMAYEVKVVKVETYDTPQYR